MFSCILSSKPALIGFLRCCFAVLRPIRAPLHNLYPFVHPKVVPVLPQFAPQRINRYEQLSFHFVFGMFSSYVFFKESHRKSACVIDNALSGSLLKSKWIGD